MGHIGETYPICHIDQAFSTPTTYYTQTNVVTKIPAFSRGTSNKYVLNFMRPQCLDSALLFYNIYDIGNLHKTFRKIKCCIITYKRVFNRNLRNNKKHLSLQTNCITNTVIKGNSQHFCKMTQNLLKVQYLME